MHHAHTHTKLFSIIVSVALQDNMLILMLGCAIIRSASLVALMGHCVVVMLSQQILQTLSQKTMFC